jgi:hypothetical protein
MKTQKPMRVFNSKETDAMLDLVPNGFEVTPGGGCQRYGYERVTPRVLDGARFKELVGCCPAEGCRKIQGHAGNCT